MNQTLLIFFVLLAPGLSLCAQHAPSLDSAIQAYEAGNYPQALAALDEVISSNQSTEDQDLALAYYYRAEARIKAMVAAAASGDAARYGRAPMESYADLRRAIKLDDGSLKASISQAEYRLFQPLLQGGLTYVNAAFNEQGNTRELLGQARLYLAAAAEIQPDNYLVFDLKAQAQLGLGDSSAAYQDFKKAAGNFRLQRPPQPDMLIAYVYYRLALLDRFYNQDLSEALHDLQAGKAQLNAEWDRVKKQKDLLGEEELLRYETQYHTSLDDLNNFELDIMLNYPDVRQEAIHKFEEAVRMEPDNYLKHLAYAQLLEEENPEKAKSIYNRAIEIDPENSVAYFNLGALYNNEGAAWFRKADESKKKKEADEFEAKGMASFRTALPLLEKAYRLEPGNRATLQALMQICITLEDKEKYELYKERLTEFK